jgi:putative ABC transport system permease protein
VTAAKARNVYAALLWAYPAAFRDEYARELSLAFADRYRDARSRWEAAQVWVQAVGGILREAPREHWEETMLDMRYALRMLRKNAGASAAAIAVLGLGIGSATLVFSLANGLLLRPLPYPQADRIVAVDEYSPTDANEAGTVNFRNYVDFRERTRLLADIGVYNAGNTTILRDGAAETVRGALVNEGVFRVLGVQPVAGRLLEREDCVPGAARVAVIGEEFWKERYGADAAAVGKTLESTNASFRIVGVMPAGFHFPDRADLWFPLRTDPAAANRTDYNRRAVARLRPGATAASASAELESMLQQIHRENPAVSNGWHARAIPLRDDVTAEYRKTVMALLVAAGFLLLIACANVGHLLLVRASARRQEMAVRAAIGASRSRLARQLAAESLTLGALGGVLGMGLAYLGTPALLQLIPVELPRWMSFRVDLRVLAFAAAVAMATALTTGLAPILGSTGGDLTAALKEGGRGGSTGRRQRWMRQALVAVEAALSVALLIGAGLTLRSFRALATESLGYAPENVLSLTITYADRAYPDGPKAKALIDRLRTEIGALPGVLSAGATTGRALDANWTRIFTIEGRPVPLKDMPFVPHMAVSPGYFRTLRLPLEEGRDFTEADFDAHVMIVSRSFARRHWPGEDAIGKRVRFGPPKSSEPWQTVVGVVADAKVRGLKETDRDAVYLAYNPDVTPNALVVRTAGDPLRMAAAVRERIAGVDRGIAVGRMLSLEQIRDQVSWRERFFAVLVTCFTGIALVLAAVGFYAVMAYAVWLERHEIGIRMALGASPWQVVRQVAGNGLRLAAVGLCGGAALGLGLTRLLQSQLYEVSAMDATAWAAAIAVFAAAAAVATVEPARRAARIDPVAALRE